MCLRSRSLFMKDDHFGGLKNVEYLHFIELYYNKYIIAIMYEFFMTQRYCIFQVYLC